MTETAVLKAESLIPPDAPAPEAQQAGGEERIRRRAYQFYLARNCEPGRVEDDWFRAEVELAEKPAEATK